MKKEIKTLARLVVYLQIVNWTFYTLLAGAVIGILVNRYIFN